VQTGTGLRRSQLRNAHSLASTMDQLRPQPPVPTPVARQTQADASDEASAIKVAARASEAKVRPIS
jgi:hypothetical protein